MADTPLRLGVLGLNNQGRDHLAVVAAPRGAIDWQPLEGVTLTALCDHSEEVLADIEAKFDIPPHVARHRVMSDALADPSVDAWAVALPHHLHGELIGLAARHRKHLLKEKPLARTLAEAQRFAEQSRAAGIVLATGVQRRYHATYERLLTELAGRPVVSARVDMVVQVAPAAAAGAAPSGPAPAGAARVDDWRRTFDHAGGGALVDLGYHAVDLLQAIVGPMTPVSCLTWSEAGPDEHRTVESHATVWARGGRSWVRVELGRGQRRVERVVVELEDEQWVADRERLQGRRGGALVDVLRAERSWERTQRAQMRRFVDLVAGAGQRVDDLDRQLPTMRFIERCYALRAAEGVLGAPSRPVVSP